MSTAWAAGSSRAWRRLRLVVLHRDGWRCQALLEDGLRCHQPATTVGHLEPLALGGPKLVGLDKLRAECARHNYSAGARLGNELRRARRPSWTW